MSLWACEFKSHPGHHTFVRAAPWPSGKAELCKSSTAGSNPTGASNLHSDGPRIGGRFRCPQSGACTCRERYPPSMAQRRNPTGIGCLPREGCCRVCAGEITGRQVLYCSARCRGIYYRNHQWIWARRAAKIRARRRDGRRVLPGWLCARCGKITFEPEVNHIVPLNGARTNLSCGHHQANLEVLCRKPCHLEVTAAQRAAGLIGRPPVAEPAGDGTGRDMASGSPQP